VYLRRVEIWIIMRRGECLLLSLELGRAWLSEQGTDALNRRSRKASVIRVGKKILGSLN